MSLLVIVLLVCFTGMVYADRSVPALPEIQGVATSTGMNVQGTMTEADSAAWSLNYGGIPFSGDDPIIASWPGWKQNDNDGITYAEFLDRWHEFQVFVPGANLMDFLFAAASQNPAEVQNFLTWLQNQGSPLTPPLRFGEVQYTTGYNDQTMAVSGQTSFVKSMAISTGNKIADQSNIKAATSMQFIAIDTGRATRTEDLLLDGAARATIGTNAILCPFVVPSPSVIPAYCNIEQAGSAFDTTLTSTVTSADTRFVGTDATIPTVLNYNINAEGLTVGNQSSPMIGSVSAYLKVHVQEARNVTTTTVPVLGNGGSLTITLNPQKSEDLVYSETSSASGLISKFSKSMSYSSQASAVPFAIPVSRQP
jgi:hypothetical protein